MSLQRRFLNLIVDNFEPGVRSLSCIDLKRTQLFDPPKAAHGHRPTSELADATSQTPAAVIQKNTRTSRTRAAVSQKNAQEVVALAAALGMEPIRLRTNTSSLAGGGGSSSSTWTFEASSLYGEGQHCSIFCFPIADRKVLCTDQCGRAILFDAESRQVQTMPTLHKFKDTPVSIFIPSADGGRLFLIGNPIRPQPRCSIGQPRCSIGQPCDDLEVLVYSKDSLTCYSQLLPPPPYVHDPSYYGTFEFKVRSYAVVDGSICISVNGLGTYCLDTASHTWSKVGEWMLPFYGKAEYVPELKLWFGLSTDTHHLAAADLSAMDAQPQLVAAWKELQPQEGWRERQDAQLVYLGSGRFCITRYFNLMDLGSKLFGQNISVFTGVEVVPQFHFDSGSADSTGNGKVKLEMICHKSRCHVPDDDGETIIRDMF